jgi:hypothetical protein
VNDWGDSAYDDNPPVREVKPERIIAVTGKGLRETVDALVVAMLRELKIKDVDCSMPASRKLRFMIMDLGGENYKGLAEEWIEANRHEFFMAAEACGFKWFDLNVELRGGDLHSAALDVFETR